MTRERYESLPLATLKELAKARNMKGVSTLKKSALIDEMLKLDETEKQMQANEKAKEEVRQEMKEKKELIRVIKTPEDEIVLDETGRKNGRGAYICKNHECFQKAKKTKALERSLKIKVSDEIYNELEKEMNSFDR